MSGAGIAIPSFWGQFPASSVAGAVPFVTANTLDYTIDVTLSFYYIPADAANLLTGQKPAQLYIKNGIRTQYADSRAAVPTGTDLVISNTVSGRFTVPAGTSILGVNNTLLTTKSIVLLTPEGHFSDNTGITWDVVQVFDGSFLLEFSAATAFESSFAYHIINGLEA